MQVRKHNTSSEHEQQRSVRLVLDLYITLLTTQ